MLTFFRRIRKGLLGTSASDKSASPTSKYLIYALGEILLVVIGILIALQINNWNEARKNKLAEHAILLDLQKDFITNQQILILQNEDMDSQISEIEFLLNLNPPIPDSIILYDLFYTYYGSKVTTFEPADVTLNEALSSGKLQILQNDSLRRHLTSWKSVLDDVKEHEGKMINFRQGELRPYMIECCPFGEEFQNYYTNTLSDQKMRTLLKLFIRNIDTQINKRKKLHKEANKISEILKKEID